MEKGADLLLLVLLLHAHSSYQVKYFNKLNAVITIIKSQQAGRMTANYEWHVWVWSKSERGNLITRRKRNERAILIKTTLVYFVYALFFILIFFFFFPLMNACSSNEILNYIFFPHLTNQFQLELEPRRVRDRVVWELFFKIFFSSCFFFFFFKANQCHIIQANNQTGDGIFF